MKLVNSDSPGKVSWLTIEFLIDEIRRANQGLTNQQSRSGRIQENSKIQFRPFHKDQSTQSAKKNRTVKMQSALRQVDDLQGIIDVVAPTPSNIIKDIP